MTIKGLSMAVVLGVACLVSGGAAQAHDEIDDLAYMLERNSGRLVGEVLAYRRPCPKYERLYHGAMELAGQASQLHELVHHEGFCRIELGRQVRELDFQFQEVQDLVDELEHEHWFAAAPSYRYSHVRYASSYPSPYRLRRRLVSIERPLDGLLAELEHQPDCTGHGPVMVPQPVIVPPPVIRPTPQPVYRPEQTMTFGGRRFAIRVQF